MMKKPSLHVSLGYFKVLAHKDEWEVARLYATRLS